MTRQSVFEYLLGFLGLLCLGLIGWGIYKLLVQIVDLLARADPTIGVAVAAGALATISSVLVVVIGRSYDARRDREASHRERKTETYDSLVQTLFEVFAGGKGAATGKEKDLIEFFRGMNRKLLLWSGPKGFKAYSEWQAELRQHEGKPRAESLIKLVDFFFALRKDLGHSNRGLERDHLVGLLLQNPELFMTLYKQDRSVTFDELATAEKIAADAEQ